MKSSRETAAALPRPVKRAALVIPDVSGLTNKEAGHAYLDSGLMPHPWRIARKNGKRTKVSCYKNFRFHEIHETHDAINAWDDRWQCGLVTSQSSGLIAGDIDEIPEFEAWDFMEFPETASAATGRAEGGRHVLLDARDLDLSDWPTMGNIPGGQIKSNGFIAAEPSIHPNGRHYKWSKTHRLLAPIGALGPALAEFRRTPSAHLLDAGDAGPERTDILWRAVLEAPNHGQHDPIRDWMWDAHDRGLSDDEMLDCLEFAGSAGRLRSYDSKHPWSRVGFAELIPSGGWPRTALGRKSETDFGDSTRSETSETTTKERAERAFNVRVKDRLQDLRINEAAKSQLRSEGWEPPGPGRSLADARQAPPMAVRQIIPGILPMGISIMAAQFKAGKTTLAINLADALGSGADFLGAYPVDFPDRNIGYWNMEVDEPQFHEWLDKCVKDETAAERIIAQHLRGKYVNFLDPLHADWTTRWLIDNNIGAWIIDPMGRMLDDENSNPEFNRWFRALEGIVRTAGTDLTFIPHHTGHAAPGDSDAVPRGRGASAQLGGSDANLSYRHGGDLGGYAPDSRRYLSGFGRGVDLTGSSEITLDFDASTGRLYSVEGAPGRHADRKGRLAEKASEAIALSDSERLNSTQLQKAIGGTPAKACEAISEAVREGLIIKTPEGRNVWYSLPDKSAKLLIRN